MFCNIGVLKIYQISHENTCARVSFFNKVSGLRPATLLKKETLTQVFSCEFCQISKKNLFYRTPLDDCFYPCKARLKACNFIKKRLQHRCFYVKFAKFLRKPMLQNIWERLLLINGLLYFHAFHYSEYWVSLLIKLHAFKDFVEFKGKHQCRSLFFNKLY